MYIGMSRFVVQSVMIYGVTLFAVPEMWHVAYPLECSLHCKATPDNLGATGHCLLLITMTNKLLTGLQLMLQLKKTAGNVTCHLRTRVQSFTLVAML